VICRNSYAKNDLFRCELSYIILYGQVQNFVALMFIITCAIGHTHT